MRSTWLASKLIQVLLELKSNHRLIDTSSQMVMVSSSWPKEDSSILVVLLDIHLSSCPAHSHAKLLPKLNFGKTKTPQNMKTVRYTFYQRNLTRRSPCSICHPSTPSLLCSLKNKLTTSMSRKSAHTSTMLTDTDRIEILKTVYKNLYVIKYLKYKKHCVI